MSDEYYKKSDLQITFTEVLHENPDGRDLLTKLWNKIKENPSLDDVHIDYNAVLKDLPKDEPEARFANELAVWIYALMTDRAIVGADAYWYNVNQAVGRLSDKYGGTGSLAAQWATALMFVTEDIITGRRVMPGERNGVLTNG